MKKVFGLLLVVLAVVCVTVGQVRFSKPVASAPDYNGTYEGSYGTGSARYTTLYRDNQDDGGRSGCRGEGCGRHPGVDIAVASGTSVYLPIDGQVVISRCDNSWGGLVVIKSHNPFRAYEYIYQIFAHLKERAYSNGVPLSVGHYITAGTMIGKTGGNKRKDACSGNSTGAHLHYQIDKDDGNPEPWFPASGTLNHADSNFVVTQNSYNPMVFLASGYRWSFNKSGNREWWDLFNWQQWGVTGGSLWLDGGFDPYIRRGGLTNCGQSKPCSSAISAEATDYKHITLTMQNNCSTGYGKIYFTTSNENYWDEQKTIFYYSPYGYYRLKDYYVGWHPKWQGVITGIRFDPADHCNAYAWDPNYFDEIILTR